MKKTRKWNATRSESVCILLFSRWIKNVRILLAVDHSEYSSEAIKEVAIRPWPPNTIVRVLSVVEPLTPSATELWYDAGGSLERVQKELNERANKLAMSVAGQLEGKGLTIETSIRDGDPRTEIVDEARNWFADLIILGSHGYTGVALSVVSHAPCSVEVVRRKEKT